MSVSRFLACGMRRNKAALSSGCNMSPTRQPPQPEATGTAMKVIAAPVVQFMILNCAT